MFCAVGAPEITAHLVFNLPKLSCLQASSLSSEEIQHRKPE
jgi:hypothetical protein